MRDHIELYWRELADVTRKMPYKLIASAAEMLLATYHRGNTIFLVGNGGSAATASHWACDLAKGTRMGGAPTFRVMPLTDNVPLLTAWGNDTSYDRVFAEQLVSLARPGDLVALISASGNSPNVLLAAEAAQSLGVTTLALTGRTGGKLRRMVDLALRVPSDSIELVEDAHMVIAHSVCVALREQLRSDALLIEPVLTKVAEPVAIELGR
jgi:D-sedoheptulose 7-phosphate isomerase